MSVDYGEVLNRLKEERERLSWSQREIGKFLNMSQAQYCKIELGSQYLKYNEVKTLSDLGMNIHYIFTGQRSDLTLIRQFQNYSYKEVICLLTDIYAKVTYHYILERSDFWKNLYQEIRFVGLLNADKGFEHNLFLMARCIRKYTQKEVAALFGVDVKKYRRLENDQCLPDSELLWKFYREFHVPPSIVLKDTNGLLYESGWLLEQIKYQTK